MSQRMDTNRCLIEHVEMAMMDVWNWEHVELSACGLHALAKHMQRERQNRRKKGHSWVRRWLGHERHSMRVMKKEKPWPGTKLTAWVAHVADAGSSTWGAQYWPAPLLSCPGHVDVNFSRVEKQLSCLPPEPLFGPPYKPGSLPPLAKSKLEEEESHKYIQKYT